MQVEGQHIYKNVAVGNRLSQELVKSVGDCIFQSFNELQKDPPNLILNLRGIGRRFVRRKKIHDRIDTLIRMREGIVSGLHYRKEMKEIDDEIKHLRTILDWYDEFTEKSKYIKTLRNDYPTPVEPPIQAKNVHQAGNSYPGEHQGLSTGQSPVPAFKDWVSPT